MIGCVVATEAQAGRIIELLEAILAQLTSQPVEGLNERIRLPGRLLNRNGVVSGPGGNFDSPIGSINLTSGSTRKDRVTTLFSALTSPSNMQMLQKMGLPIVGRGKTIDIDALRVYFYDPQMRELPRFGGVGSVGRELLKDWVDQVDRLA